MGYAGGATEWTEQMAQCLLGATLRSARNNDLYLLLLHCASRQPVGAASLSDPGEIVESPLRERLDAELQAATAKFFGSLLQLACNTSEAPQDYTPDDPLRWYDGLTNYASRNGRRALDDLLAACGGAARPNRDAERVRSFGKAYFEFVGEAARIGAIMEREYTDRLLAKLEHARRGGAMLEFRAASGEIAAAELWVENTRTSRTRICARVPELRRADGVGPSFVPPVRVEPGEFALEPSQEASVHVSLRLDADQFTPDALYVGHVHLQRSGEPEVRIPLRVIAISAELRP